MKRTLTLYFRLLRVQFRSQLQFRSSFLLDIVTTLIVTLSGFGTLALVLQRFGDVGGWKLAEIAFLYGIVETAFGVMDMVFSGFDPPFFGRLIRLGRLDQLLLRPISVTVQVLGSQFLLRRLGRIFQGALIFSYATANLDIHWDLLKLIYLPVVIVSTVCFFGGLFIIGSTITFWSVDSIEIMNIFTYGGTEMMSYPMHIYQDWLRKFFTFILPSIFIVYYPALFYLGKPDPFHFPVYAPFISPIAGFGVLVAGVAFWNYGLRHYQSTGS
jgi:ABC-2 type transport system permease protein